MNLALKYRPRKFSDVVGQKVATTILQAAFAKDSLLPVLLFTGPSGVGKTTLARIVAAELNPDYKEDVFNGTHPDVLEIDGASNGNVDAIRDLKRDVNFASLHHRVIIIDEMHAMSDEAKTALLNMLEFPPKNVTFILLTTELHKVPIMVRHRADHYPLVPATINDLVERLSHVNSAEGLEMAEDLLNLIAQRSEGSYRRALMILEQLALGDIKDIQTYNKLQGEIDFGPSLIRSTLQGSASALVKLEEVLTYASPEDIVDRTIETLKDLMLLNGGIELSYSDEALEARNSLVKHLGSNLLLKAMKIIWDLQTKLGAANKVRSLELAYSLLGEIFKVEELPAQSTISSKPMGLAAMKNFRG